MVCMSMQRSSHLLLSLHRPLLNPRSTSFLLRRMATNQAFSVLKDQTLIKTQGIINGKWIDAKQGKTFAVHNPANGEILGHVPEMSVAETKEAIDAASAAFKTWSQVTAKHRHDLMKKWYDLIMANHDDLGTLITLENGKSLAMGKGENVYAASFIEYFAEEAVRVYGEVIPSPYPDSRSVVIRQPVGVVGALTPWNFPSAMITRKVGPALAAGCTVVIKPPPETPFSCLALVELANRAGIPDGVLNVVTTLDNVREVAAELCENKIVKKITFTGSTAVAKELYRLGASTMKKVSFEAGGNAPFIVFDDADLDEAVKVAVACKFRASGQTCICANRIYVQSSVYAEFAARLAEKVSAFKVGDGIDPETTHGPLIHGRAVDKVDKHVQDAVKRGASVLVGGSRMDRPGHFYQPTVLADVPQDALLTDEETFGPVAGLISFETEEEVLALANKSDYGLAGYFFSRNISRVWKIAEALEVGMVGVNSNAISQVYTPFGGIKDSGLGREGSRHGIDEYLNKKLIVMGI